MQQGLQILDVHKEETSQFATITLTQEHRLFSLPAA